jgi:transposase-like protein
MQQSYVTRSHQEIEHPKCAACGSPMWLTRIEPYKVDHDQRTFECKACGKTQIEIVKYR